MSLVCGTRFVLGRLICLGVMVSMITDTISYVGVDDLELDLFESQYAVPNGMAYNSYLVFDERVALMDAVDRRKSDVWLEKVHRALAGRKPDYLVIHHMEPDHSGAILQALERYPAMKIVGSARAILMLGQFFDGVDFSHNTLVVKEGDTLSLGERELRFYAAPMVHWPEVMVSYDTCDRVLFSADAFGKFGALSCNEEWVSEARRYYFNICGKYGVSVQALLKKVAELDVACICPLHGPVLRSKLNYYIDLYAKWSSYEPETEGVFVAYASIHGGTAEAARRLAELLYAKGAKRVMVADLCRYDRSRAVANAFRMSRLVVAASSYDGGLFPPMYDFLHHLQIKGYQRRRVGIIENGSWAPSADRVMRNLLGQMAHLELISPTVTIHSRLKQQDEHALEALAAAMLK